MRFYNHNKIFPDNFKPVKEDALDKWLEFNKVLSETQYPLQIQNIWACLSEREDSEDRQKRENGDLYIFAVSISSMIEKLEKIIQKFPVK